MVLGFIVLVYLQILVVNEESMNDTYPRLNSNDNNIFKYYNDFSSTNLPKQFLIYFIHGIFFCLRIMNLDMYFSEFCFFDGVKEGRSSCIVNANRRTNK